MQVQEATVKIQKLYRSRREALNVFEALHPEVSPVLFSATDRSGQQVFVAESDKIVALISDVEYTVVKVEDPQEGIENAE